MTKQQLWYMRGRCLECGHEKESKSKRIPTCAACQATQYGGMRGVILRARSK